MNIFYLSKSAKRAARYHNDKHCVKMILETCQLLYTCLWLTMISDNWIDSAPKTKSGQRGYKKAFVNHPCAIWVRESIDNYNWLCRFGIYLCKEYTHRYDKVHSCEEHLAWLSEQKPPLDNIGMTKIRLAMPDKYKSDDPIQSYRNYYMGEKKNFCNWKNRKTPYWFK